MGGVQEWKETKNGQEAREGFKETCHQHVRIIKITDFQKHTSPIMSLKCIVFQSYYKNIEY